MQNSSTIVPQSSIAGGNTKTPAKKQISPSKRWCFTLNNYTPKEVSSITYIIKTRCSLGIIGDEVGHEGTPHLQGYFEFQTKARPIGIFGNGRIHFEKCKGNRQKNIDYCSKEGKVIFRHNIPDPYNIDISLNKWETFIKDEILDTEPDDRSIYWFWEEEGCAGKTTFQKWIFLNYQNVIITSGKIADMKNSVLTYIQNTNMYPKYVLVNIPRVNNGNVSIAGLECIKDMFFYSPKYEGGQVCGPNPHIIVFANEEPDYEKLSQDRWKVHNLQSF
ncbi:MAG: putative viral replication protein [Cressdnaviricota sp.]|nr:MAG: putative viral replication protein [Cressdnaviricota sp.]